MNQIDLLIIAGLVLGIARGVQIGLFRQVLSVAGFFGGLVLGSLLAQYVASFGQDVLLRAFLILGVTLGTAVILAGIGELFGLKLRGLAERYSLGPFDDVLGAGFEIITVLATVWLLSPWALRLPNPNLQREIQQSRIVQTLNDRLPPSPPLIARIAQLIEPNGFPRVFIGSEPSPAPVTGPSSANLNQALAAAGGSTVKLEGQGCGGIVEGSGFVADSGLVVTNAHVIAGVRNITVTDRFGSHRATPVWFDPNLDFAVVRTSGLAGAPLAIDAAAISVGTSGVVLGYPGGGPLAADPAVVSADITAIGRNIYDQGRTARDVYELAADVQPGNSGGPLVLSDGTVIGLVFAKSAETDGVGFALTSPQFLPELHQAEASRAPVGVGGCAAPD